MNLEKCTRCKAKFAETTTSYYKRTKDIFNPLPFICYECIRIINLFNPTQKEFKKTQKEYRKQQNLDKEVHYHKVKLKTNVKRFQENEKVIKLLKKEDKERKKQCKKNNAFNALQRKKSVIQISEIERQLIREFYYNSPSGHHVDHIIPISKGGKHCLDNLQYLPAKENMRKGNKIIVDVLEQYLENESLSIPFLQRKFKLTFQDARNILKEIGILET